MEITQERVKLELENILKGFEEFGIGNDSNQGAYIILDFIDTFRKRLEELKNDSEMGSFVTDPLFQEVFPKAVYEISKSYIEGKLDEKSARHDLDEARKQYTKLFKEMGIKPKKVDLDLFIV